jgi:hypothetical protein
MHSTVNIGLVLMTLLAPIACDPADASTVGPRGGTIVSADGRFSIEIPAGALDTDVDIEVTETGCATPRAVGSCYVVEPRGTTFFMPAEVTYELADMPLSDRDRLQLGVMVERDDGWQPLADRDVDIDDATVRGSVLYLSTFAVTML